jgi:hypothetical protein
MMSIGNQKTQEKNYAENPEAKWFKKGYLAKILIF